MQSHLVETFGPDAFRPKSPFEAIKTVEDAYKAIGAHHNSAYVYQTDNSVEWNKSMFYNDALCVARALNRIANGGEDWEWKPKEDDTWAYQIVGGVDMTIGVEQVKMARPGSLRFVTEAAAQYFIENFQSLITALK